MKKKEIVDRISVQTGIRKQIISAVLKAYKDIVLEELYLRHSIRIENIGTLRFVQSISRNGFNPLRQKLELFKGKNKIKFIPSKGLDRMINPREEN